VDLAVLHQLPHRPTSPAVPQARVLQQQALLQLAHLFIRLVHLLLRLQQLQVEHLPQQVALQHQVLLLLVALHLPLQQLLPASLLQPLKHPLKRQVLPLQALDQYQLLLQALLL